MPKAMKQWIQGAIRGAHLRVLGKPLPDRLAIYFHCLEAHEHSGFEEMIEYFRDAGYAFCSVDRFFDGGGKKVWLSLDDNYRSWFESLDLLERHGVKATFFVNSLPLRDRASEEEIQAYYDRLRHVGDRVPLDSEELRALALAGHTIGCHTHSHARLTALPLDEAKKEILKAKQSLETVLSRPVEHFSYPFGLRRHFSEALRDFCRSIGIRSVSNAIPAMQHAGHTPWRIQRSIWQFELPLEENLDNLRVDGRWFERLTGRSAVG